MRADLLRIDLNADVGEGFSHDEELMEIVTSVNVGCGAHAGSPELSIATAERARQLGLKVAAHPGYPDRAGFGRRMVPHDPEEWLPGQLSLFAHDAVKPHGAFYHHLKSGIWPEVRFSVPVIGVPRRGLRTIAEGFAERGYGEDGKLLPRDAPGAIIHDPEKAARQAASLAATGRYETICVHGDSPNAVAVARAVRAALVAEGFSVEPWS